MQINITFDQATSSLPTGFVTAVNYVVNYFDSLFTNNCSINICVGYGEVGGNTLGSNALGESISTYFATNYTSLRNALLAENAPGSSTLPTTSPLSGTPVVTQAEAKALGLTSITGIDGHVGFSNTYSWDYTTAAPSAGQYYLIGTIEHEITEVLGRQSMINYAPSDYSAMDLYRYSAPGVRSVATGGSGSTAYFSINNGTTNLATWNNNSSNGDLGDWYPSGPAAGGKDALNDYSSSGVINTFSATDITNMQAIGWTVASGAAAPTIASFSPDRGVVGDGITNANVLTLTGAATASSTVNVYDGATLLGTAVADASGAWSYTTGTLSNGSHSFTATDTVSGTTSAASAALSVTVDTTAPVAPSITSFSPDSGVVGDGITNVNVLTLTGTAEANSTVKVYDGATLLGSATANGSGAWSYTTAALSNGAHSLTATATDAAGNTGVASSALAVTIDTTAPVAPSITSFSPDSGVVGDHITNVNTLTLTGTAEANSTVKVYDGATLLGSATANGSGAWSYTTAALGNSAHNLTATATDAAGNTGVASGALAVTIDTTAPVAPSITSFSPDSGVVGDGITNVNTLTLSGTAEANSTVKVYDGATLLGSATANGSGAWSYTTAALANGAHSLTATAADVAGNTGVASTALSLTVDTVAPNTPVIASDATINTNAVMLTGTAEAGSTVTVFDGATQIGTTTVNTSGAWSFTTGPMSNGAHSFTVTATDAAGNTSQASQPIDPIIDTTAPAAPTITSFSTDSGTVGDGITNVNVLTLTGTAEANSTVKVYDGATLLGSATTNGSGAWSYTTAALANGAHSLTATATDVAGNTGVASTALSVTVDTVAPNAPVIASDATINTNEVMLTGTAEAGSTVTVFDGATQLGTTTVNTSGAWSFTTGPISDGAHTFTVTATDAAGNTSQASQPIDPIIDTTAPAAPTITSFSPDSGVVGDGITNDNTLTLTGTAEANSTVKVYDGATLLGTTTANGTGAWNFVTAALANGTQAFTATATNAAGNTSTASSALNVTVDTTAPVAPTISSFSPASSTPVLTLSGTAEASSTVKVYDGATLLGTAIANGSGAWSFATATLANGTHAFTATATDAASNTSTASSALNVTVDTIAPAGTEGLKTWNADGTIHDIHIYGLTGVAFTNYDVVYGANGKAATEVWANGATTIQSETWNTDGTVHDIHYYGITGQAYTDYDVVYGANNKPASASYSNGMTETWTYNPDGTLHELDYNGITGQKYTSTDTLYGSNRSLRAAGDQTVRRQSRARLGTPTARSTTSTITGSPGRPIPTTMLCTVRTTSRRARHIQTA